MTLWLTKQQLATPRKLKTTVMKDYFIKGLGLVVSFPPFYFSSQMSIMFRLDQSYLKSECPLEVNLTKYPVMQGFNRKKPIIDQTLLVDQPLFQALTIF